MNNLFFHPGIPMVEAAHLAESQGCRLQQVGRRLRAVPADSVRMACIWRALLAPTLIRDAWVHVHHGEYELACASIDKARLLLEPWRGGASS